ncbi:MAG: glycoside hydrolase family 3 C-terminal domain-containing protein, partial [Anaerolineaceae bacterium]|nr:glycoside hydrolase family 3 C-terminal domain-containing protein [Anaerolineaceae bacterium]
PLAADAGNMLGSWSFTGLPKDVVTILAGIQSAVSEQSEVLYAPGCTNSAKDPADFSQAVAAASQADVLIAVVGETSAMSGEASSRVDLGLPAPQDDLLEALFATGKPLVVVLINGRPLALPWLAGHAAAILEAWQPGVQAGPAVADVLFGDYNPSAKLAATFPYTAGQVPLYYNHPSTGRPPGDFKFTSKYIDGPVTPLFPFGFGLSYTTFSYADLEITPAEVEAEGKLTVSASITNTGMVFGEEVVQLYIADLVASRVRPVRELKGFQKIAIAPGETRRVTFDLPAATLGFFDQEMQYVVEPGQFKVWVGPNSHEGLAGEFRVQ